MFRPKPQCIADNENEIDRLKAEREALQKQIDDLQADALDRKSSRIYLARQHESLNKQEKDYDTARNESAKLKKNIDEAKKILETLSPLSSRPL